MTEHKACLSGPIWGEREVIVVEHSSSPGEWQDLTPVPAGRRGRRMSEKKAQPQSLLKNLLL